MATFLNGTFEHGSKALQTEWKLCLWIEPGRCTTREELIDGDVWVRSVIVRNGEDRLDWEKLD